MQAHMKLARNKKVWTMLDLPEQRGSITVSDVLRTEPGQAKDLIIREWCASVRDAYKNWHDVIGIPAMTELGVK